MKDLEVIINRWKKDRRNNIEIGSLYSRNPNVHKWKGPFRSLVIRELVFWRLTDLIDNTLLLLGQSHVLGARILLRSAYETLGVLIYLNQKIDSLIDGKNSFSDFNKITVRLMLGAKSDYSDVKSINVLTVLEKSDKKFPGILGIYNDLSESSHPNFEGMSLGYSDFDSENYIISFKNNWIGLYMKDMRHLIMTCIKIFEYEYNDEWPGLFEKLENWIDTKKDKN